MTAAAAAPAPDAVALRGRGLGCRYGQGAPVFAGVSLDIGAREIVALLGGSGCGKSTLLRTLAGLQAPTQGQVEFLGAPLAAPHPRAAVVFQQPSLLPWLDVAANAGFGLGFTHQPRATRGALQARVQAALEAVGLAGKAHLYPAALSGGMAQRVALARALAREPRLLLADEPFSALDAITRTGMQALLVDVVHRWHTAALLVTHDIDEAIGVADRILLMGPQDGEAGQPAGVVREWRVDIARPRHAHPAAATALHLDILQALHDVHAIPSTT
ncbi:MAG: ABC transporter ATP-binding protein [Comamonadaceae bacterium]|nr:ABC transporter ATP-binding protein [Comamonadaceae bacterium]MBN9367772.1 ABC transporter ATP-binding protein [Comamonadaceae bacterium]